MLNINKLTKNSLLSRNNNKKWYKKNVTIGCTIVVDSEKQWSELVREFGQECKLLQEELWRQEQSRGCVMHSVYIDVWPPLS